MVFTKRLALVMALASLSASSVLAAMINHPLNSKDNSENLDRCQGQGLRDCINKVQENYTHCTVEDMECRCGYAYDAMDQCYDGCETTMAIRYIRMFVKDYCDLAASIVAAGGSLGLAADEALREERVHADKRFQGDSDLQHRDDHLPSPFPEGDWEEDGNWGNERQDDDLEEDTQVPQFDGRNLRRGRRGGFGAEDEGEEEPQKREPKPKDTPSAPIKKPVSDKDSPKDDSKDEDEYEGDDSQDDKNNKNNEDDDDEEEEEEEEEEDEEEEEEEPSKWKLLWRKITKENVNDEVAAHQAGDSVEKIEPVKHTEPVEPEKPIEHIDPVEPEKSVELTEPADPVETTNPEIGEEEPLAVVTTTAVITETEFDMITETEIGYVTTTVDIAPTEVPADDRPTNVPTEEVPAEAPTDITTEIPEFDNDELPTSEESETATEEPKLEPIEDLESEPTEEPVTKPIEELEPEHEPIEEPGPEPTEEPVTEPIEEPKTEPIEELEPEPTEEPEPEPTEEPKPEPTDEPKPEPTDESEPKPSTTENAEYEHTEVEVKPTEEPKYKPSEDFEQTVTEKPEFAPSTTEEFKYEPTEEPEPETSEPTETSTFETPEIDTHDKDEEPSTSFPTKTVVHSTFEEPEPTPTEDVEYQEPEYHTTIASTSHHKKKHASHTEEDKYIATKAPSTMKQLEGGDDATKATESFNKHPASTSDAAIGNDKNDESLTTTAHEKHSTSSQEIEATTVFESYTSSSEENVTVTKTFHYSTSSSEKTTTVVDGPTEDESSDTSDENEPTKVVSKKSLSASTSTVTTIGTSSDKLEPTDKPKSTDKPISTEKPNHDNGKDSEDLDEPENKEPNKETNEKKKSLKERVMDKLKIAFERFRKGKEATATSEVDDDDESNDYDVGEEKGQYENDGDEEESKMFAAFKKNALANSRVFASLKTNEDSTDSNKNSDAKNYGLKQADFSAMKDKNKDEDPQFKGVSMLAASGANAMAACWVPLFAVFATMAYYDLSPAMFFVLAGIVTAYIYVFIPELSGGTVANAAAGAANLAI